MKIEKLVAALNGVPPDSCDPAIDWDHRARLWTALANCAESLLVRTIPAAFCTAQEWDNRIDCVVRLKDGSLIGEMVSLAEVNTERLHETAERLRRAAFGEKVELIDPIQPPLPISGPLPTVR